jgi:hypothetical protein
MRSADSVQDFLFLDFPISLAVAWGWSKKYFRLSKSWKEFILKNNWIF